jgi:hypothetical protein
MTELISVFCRDDHWYKVVNIRSRSVFEMETCLVFTPDNPNLYSLNSTAWLVFELCDGRNFEELEAAYIEAVEPLRSDSEASDELKSILLDLKEKGIVRQENESVTAVY